MKRPIKKTHFYPIPILFWLTLVIGVLTGSNFVYGQINCGSINCNSQDVKIKRAYLLNPDGSPLTTCVAGQPFEARLHLDLITSTPRVGVSISGTINVQSTNAVVASFGQCFSTSLTTSGSGITTVAFSQLVTWTCGQQIQLRNTLISWGTGNENFCIGSPDPEPAKCPATKSKCWLQGATDIIVIETFPCISASLTQQPANEVLCAGSRNATFTVGFTEGSPSSTIQWQVSNDGGTNWADISNGAQYSGTTSATLTVINPGVSLSGNKYRALLTNNTSTHQCGVQTNGMATLTVNSMPGAPTVSVVNNCNNTSVLTASNLSAGATLTWSPAGGTVSGNTYTVTTSGSFQVTQSTNGCISTAGSGNAAPKSTPASPVVSVQNNCNGSSILTVTNLALGGTLSWTPTGGVVSGNTYTVTSAGTYMVTQSVDGCTSANGSGNATPGNVPEKAVSQYLAPACDQAVFSVRITNATVGDVFSILDKAGNPIPGVQPSNSVTATRAEFNFSNIPAGSGYQISTRRGLCDAETEACGSSPTSIPIGTGPVTSHEQRNALSLVTDESLGVKAYPNPFNDVVNFRIYSPESGKASLQLFDLTGRLVGQPFQGMVTARTPVYTRFQFTHPSGVLIYRMLINGKTITGKLMAARN